MERNYTAVSDATFTTHRNDHGDGEDGGGGEILSVAGHAAVFNSQTLIGSTRFGFVERIAEGAFDNVLADDVRFLFNHDGIPLARTSNGSLRLSVDAVGLVVNAELNPDVSLANDVFAAVSRGDITQMSFAFTILDDDVELLSEDHDKFPGMILRTIKKIGRLHDVSAVTYPAYEEADIGARGLVTDEDIRTILKRVEAPQEEIFQHVASAEDVNRLRALAASRT